MKLLTLLLFASIMCAQKVQVFDIDGNLINDTPIEKKDVPNALFNTPNGRYLIIELKAVKDEKGDYYFKKCWFDKTYKNEMV